MQGFWKQVKLSRSVETKLLMSQARRKQRRMTFYMRPIALGAEHALLAKEGSMHILHGPMRRKNPRCLASTTVTSKRIQEMLMTM